MREELARRFAYVEGMLAQRFRTAQDVDELPGHDLASPAAVVGAAALGMMLRALAGVDASGLRQIEAMAVVTRS